MSDLLKLVRRTSIRENLEDRRTLRRKAQKDAGLREAIRTACKHDILFWLNAFAWLHEPRPRFDNRGKLLPKVFPFLTWPHQDREFLRVRQHLGIDDVGIEKCRGEGWTWFMCWTAVQFWLFEEDSQVGLVSSTEDKSDSPNLGSIMGKVDWGVAKLPSWMTGVKGKGRSDGDWYRNLSEHALVNTQHRTQVIAFAASPDTGRGDRFTWFGLDEHASDEWKQEQKDERVLDSIRGATDSIMYISTPKGAHGAFHRIMTGPSSVEKVIIDWRDNPTKNQGLYRLEGGKPVAVDPINNPLAKDYVGPSQLVLDLFSRLRKNGFELEKGSRSPWLDRECDRGGATPQSIAQEHERDYGGAMQQIFGATFMEKAEATARTPDIVGELSVYDDLTYEFDRKVGGDMRLWCPLDAQGKPPHRQYVVCADVATGEGGAYCSNSVIHVIDLITKEQVLEYATRIVKPMDFADKAIAISKWFFNAYLAWEHMGPGAAFTTQIIERGYAHCYERTTMDKATKKRTKKLGFDNRGAQRESLFGDLERFVRMDELIVRSRSLLDEFPQYIREGKDIKHVSTKSGDPTHGDRVIAIGVGVQAMKDRPIAKDSTPAAAWGDGPPPLGTMAHREWLMEQNKDDDGWDDRATADFRLTGGQFSLN
jgi:hypothetical protein